jgi:hypothetical protein
VQVYLRSNAVQVWGARLEVGALLELVVAVFFFPIAVRGRLRVWRRRCRAVAVTAAFGLGRRRPDISAALVADLIGETVADIAAALIAEGILLLAFLRGVVGQRSEDWQADASCPRHYFLIFLLLPAHRCRVGWVGGGVVGPHLPTLAEVALALVTVCLYKIDHRHWLFFQRGVLAPMKMRAVTSKVSRRVGG